MGKIVIASDFHLRFSAQFDKILENGTPSRLQEIIDSVDWVIKVGKEYHASVFISSGDTFDAAERLNTKEGLAILELFKRVRKAFPKNYWITGNHDAISNNHNILDLFSQTINVFSKPSFLDIQDCRLFFLPYLRETADIYSAINEFEKNYDCPGKKYFFGHFWDSKTISVDPDAVDLSKINTNFFDRMFTGHFHVPSNDLNSKVVYLGTLLNKKFSESGKKGCWILDTEKNFLEFVENPYSPEFITTVDTNLLLNLETLNTNAYYRIYTSPENVIEITKILGSTKGFELLTKNNEENSEQISILNIEKKNSSSLKEYILNNAELYLPEGVKLEEFKEIGEHFMSNL